jgi:hypothetical protein
MEEVSTDLNTILQNAADLSGILSAPRREEEQAAAAIAASNRGLVTEAVAANIATILPQTFTQSSMYLGGIRAQVLATVEDAYQSAISATTQEDRDAFLQRRDALAEATIGAMARGLAASTTRDGVAMLRAQIARGAGYDTQQGRIAEQMLQRLEAIAPGSRDALLAQISGYQEDLAHEQNVLEERSAQYVRDNILPDLASVPFMSGATLTQEVSDLVGAINSTPNLRDSDRVAFGRDVYVAATRGALNEAYLQLTSEDQLIVAGQYLSGASGGQTLPQPVRDALDLARQYSIQTGQDRLLTTESNSIAADRRNVFRRRQEIIERQESAAAALLGVNPEGSDDAVLEMVNYQLAQSGGSLRESIGPMFFANPDNVAAFPDAFRTIFETPGLEPTGLLTMFSAAAGGGVLDAHTLAMWEQYSNLETSSGVFPRAISGMRDEEVAAMNLMLELSRTMPISDLPAVSQAAREYLNENRGEITFEGRTAIQVAEGIDAFQELMPAQQQAVLAHTEFVMSLANTTPTAISSRRDLERAITRMIDETYTVTDGNVLEITPNGNAVNRSSYAPQRFLGDYTDRWYDLIRTDLSALTDAPVVFAGELGGNVMYEASQLAAGGTVPISTAQQFSDDLEAGTRYITLVPIGPDSLGGMSYSVYQMNTETLQLEPVTYTEGDLQGLAVQVSTAEEEILNIMQIDVVNRNAEQRRLGTALRESIDRGLTEGYELQGLPDWQQDSYFGQGAVEAVTGAVGSIINAPSPEDIRARISAYEDAASRARDPDQLRVFQQRIRQLEAMLIQRN